MHHRNLDGRPRSAAAVGERQIRLAVNRLAELIAEPQRMDETRGMFHFTVHPAHRRLAIRFDLVAAPEQLQQHRYQHVAKRRRIAEDLWPQILHESLSCPGIDDDGCGGRHEARPFGTPAPLDEGRFREAGGLSDEEPHAYSAACRSPRRSAKRGMTSSVKSFSDRIAA